HVERLADDHARARRLADGLRGVPGVNVPAPETNIVMIELVDAALDRDALVRALRARDVWMGGSGPRRIRAIAHLDVDDAGIDRAIAGFQAAAAEVLAAPAGRPA
ncbi:MAG: low specificity L-threonine aldolase, partial [Candidatus Eiseniibacteriota bacterium]